MPAQYQGGVQGFQKPAIPNQALASAAAAQPNQAQQTPGGLFGSISNNPYQSTGGGGGGGVSSGYTNANPGITSNANPNRTNWLTDNGRVNTGADTFRQFGDQYYNYMMNRTADQRAQADQSLQQSLVNRGLQPGTEAYNAEMARLDQRNNDFMSGTAVQAEQLGLAAQNQYFGQEMANNQYDLSQNQQNYMQGFG